jgi:TPR repeat protein
MQLITITGRETSASLDTVTDLGLARWLAAASEGDTGACFDLGVAYSTGSNGAECDLIEAHKWFNLAALAGDERGHGSRAEIAWDMTAREIAEAQRAARAWLGAAQRRAA